MPAATHTRTTEEVLGCDVEEGDVLLVNGDHELRVSAILTGPGVADIVRPGVRAVSLYSLTYREPMGAPRSLRDTEPVFRVRH